MKAQMKLSGRGYHGASLPKTEMVAYLVLWLYSLFRAMYTAYRYALDFKPLFPPQDFTPGWFFVSREKDLSDYEWTVWASKYIKLIPWILGHVVISLCLWQKNRKYIPHFYLLSGILCLAYFLRWVLALFLLIQPLFMFLAHFSQKKYVCWLAGLLFLVSVNVHPFTQVRELFVRPYSRDEYIVSVVMAWTTIRCLSFCLHRCDHPRTVTLCEDFMNYLGFCFYLPLLFTGPLMMFNDFESQMHMVKPRWTVKRTLFLSANIVRYLFWYVFNEVFLHFVYIFALGLYPHLVSRMSIFGLCGLAYLVSQFFMVKYCVMYGLPGAIAQIESYQAPIKPKCVARIHLYSDMWRFFDRGLYCFLKRYIYIPSIGKSPSMLRKLLGSAICFVFIYIWHGVSFYILLWSLLNYIGIVLENLGRYVASLPSIKSFQERNLSPQWTRRITAMIITPLLVMSSISNFYFLLRYEVGQIIFRKTIWEAPASTLVTIYFFMYCMCQVSIEIKNWETRRQIKCKE